MKLEHQIQDERKIKSLVPINQTETNSLTKFTIQETEKSTQVRSACPAITKKKNLSTQHLLADLKLYSLLDNQHYKLFTKPHHHMKRT